MWTESRSLRTTFLRHVPRGPAASTGTALLALLAVAPTLAPADVLLDPPIPVSDAPARGGGLDFTSADSAVDSSGVLHIAWSERQGGGNTSPTTVLLYRRSHDGGQTFTAPQKLLDGGLYSMDFQPELATSGGAVYLAYRNAGKGNPGHIGFLRSVDGGTTFQSQIMVSQSPGGSTDARIVVAPSGVIFVLWAGLGYPGPGVYLARSFDGGTTFETPRALVYGEVGTPDVAVDRATGVLYAVWDQSPSIRQVWFTRSVDGGASFTTPLNLSNAPVEARTARVAVGSAGRVHVAFQQAKQPLQSQGTVETTPYNLMYTLSVNAGNGFSLPQIVSNAPSNLARSADFPALAEGPNGALAIGWEERNKQTHPGLPPPTPPVVVLKVVEAGHLILGPPQAVAADPAAGSTDLRPVFGPEGNLYLVWQEGTDVLHTFFRRAVGVGAPAPPPPSPPPPPPVLAIFGDVPLFYWAQEWIETLYGAGVTGGCSTIPLLYCPESVVTREQMAAFIIRAMGEFGPPLPPFQRFGDVPPSSPFYRFIDRMAALGITGGCGGGNYCPQARVTREQMAAFIIRALGEFSDSPPAAQRFLDVPASNPFFNFIDRMAVLGITAGCSSMNYCPLDAVTRAQMAVFLVRAFNL